jgi:hypothetical protein
LSGHFLQVSGAAESALREHTNAPFHPEAFHAYFKALYCDLTPETWSRLNVSLGLFEGGQDATETTYAGTDHKQAAGG